MPLASLGGQWQSKLEILRGRDSEIRYQHRTGSRSTVTLYIRGIVLADDRRSWVKIPLGYIRTSSS